jgi:uncharacterized protein
MQVPYSRLSLGALRGVVEQFVTRDGTDHSLVDRRVAVVIEQLERGDAVLTFDEVTKNCQIRLASGEGHEDCSGKQQ